MRDLVKKAAFLPRLLSANQRKSPDFILIGAHKAGSSALYRHLYAHPDLVRAFRKEPDYFSIKYNNSQNWYKAHFPLSSSKSICGDGSPSYFSHPLTASRVKKDLGDIKLILIVRNPVQRAISHYFHSVRYGWQNEEISIEKLAASDQLIADWDRMKTEEGFLSKSYFRLAYLHRGDYAVHLTSWLEHYDLSQILILRNEDLSENPEALYNQAIKFLNLKEWSPESFGRFNVGIPKKYDDSIVNWLKEYYAPKIQEFEEICGRSFHWD